MSQSGPSLKKNDYLLIVTGFYLSAYIVLFLARALDDNRLVSWESAFLFADAPTVFLFLCAGLVPAFLIALIPLPQAGRGLLLFCLSFSAAALFWREPEVIVDASRYFTQAKYLELYGAGYFLREWGTGISAWTDMPLLPFLYGLLFRFAGEGRVYVQLFTTILFSLSVLLVYGIGRRLWNEDVGFYAGLLMPGMPYLLTQVPLMLVDVPTMFFFVLAVYTFIRALHGGWGMTVAAACAVFLSVYSKYSTWPMLSVLGVISLVYSIVAARKKLPEGSGFCDTSHDALRPPYEYLVRSCVIALCSVLLVATAFWLKSDVFIAQMKLLLAYQRPGLSRWGESFLSSFCFQTGPFVSLAALYSVYAAYRQRDLKFVIIAWLPVLVIVMQIKRIRYIIMVLPLLSLMAAYGLARIRELQVVRFIVFSVVAFSLVVSLFVSMPLLQRMSSVNLKSAGHYLDTLPADTIEVITLPPSDPVVNMAVAVPLLDLFTRKQIIYGRDSAIGPPPADLETSSLRFTWEYQVPAYYKGTAGTNSGLPLVIISDSADRELPESLRERLNSYRLEKTFSANEGIFRFRTSVRIYQKKNPVSY